MTDYGEILLQSVQTLIDKSLADLPSDKNVVCTITDNTNREVGQYKASSNNNVIYNVYADKTTYRVGDQVVVLFPQDDTQNKIILSKYIVEDAQEKIAYVSPFDNAVQVTTNLASGLSGSLTANSNTEFVELGTILSPELKDSKFYDTICLSADFSCFLSSYDIRSGHYGILIEGYTSSAETAKPVAVMQLDSDSMFGNPYAFITPFTQEIIFHYDIENDFAKLKLYLYQSNDFTYFDGVKEQEVPAKWSGPIGGSDNIFVDNINLYLAYDVVSVTDNTVKILTKDTLVYGEEDGINKQIELVWYNKTEDNQFVGFSDGFFSADAKKQVGTIKSKRASENGGFSYTLQETGFTVFLSETEYAEGNSVFYTRGSSIADSEGNAITGFANSNGKSYYWIEWLVDNANGVLDVANAGSSEKYTVACRRDLSMTEVQAKVWCNGESYTSNIIQFTNQDINANNINHLGIELSFEHIEPGYSTYALYGADNQLIQPNDANVMRTIRAKWTSKTTDLADSFWDNAIITWGIPKVATMLNRLSTMSVSSETDTYYYYSFPYSNDNLTFKYLIKKTYVRNYSNNLITCSIKLPRGRGTVYGSEPISFSSLGSNGTDYTFVIDTTVSGFPWKSSNETRVNFKATLRDANNQELPINKIVYSRVGGSALDDNYVRQKSVDFDRFNLVKGLCEAEWGGRIINLETYLPIIYSRDAKYVAQAPSNIVYNTLGTLQDTSAALPLKLLDMITGNEVFNIDWQLLYQNKTRTSNAETTVPEALQTWVPSLNKNQAFIGQVLEGGYVGLIGTSLEKLVLPAQIKYSFSNNDNKVVVSPSTEGPLNLIEEKEHLYQWKYNNTTSILTTEIKNDDNNYTFFNNEIFDRDIYEIAQEYSESSRWGAVAITNVNPDTTHEYRIVTLSSVKTNDDVIQGEFIVDGTVYEVFFQQEGNPVPSFIPSTESKYLIYKENDKYYFLTSVQGSPFQIGLYERYSGEDIESEIVEYRYLFSTQLKGNIPTSGSYVLFDKTLKYMGKAPTNELSLGVYTTYSISFPNMYMDTGYLCILQAYLNQGGVKTLLWSQPLPVLQYKYGSALLNNWDGNLKVDDENNYILTAMMGAGVKNSDNTFSGVLMGDMGKLTDGTMTKTIGLYGYNKGEQSFGFKVDGTAFLGKSGKGRIVFDGNSGIIQSSSDKGMTIDLDDGKITAYNFDLSATSTGKIPQFPAIQPNISPSTFIPDGSKAYVTIEKGVNKLYGKVESENNEQETCEINFEFKCGSVELLKNVEYLFTCRLKTHESNYAIKKVQITLTNSKGETATFKQESLTIVNTFTDLQIPLINKKLSNTIVADKLHLLLVLKGTYDNLKEPGLTRPCYFQSAEQGQWIQENAPLSLSLSNTKDEMFYVGDATRQNFISYKISDGLEIKTTQFNLSAGSWSVTSGKVILSTSGISDIDPGNSDLHKNYRFGIGNNTNYMYFTKNGQLVINTEKFKLDSSGDVDIEGKITVAEGSTIADWYVSDTGIMHFKDDTANTIDNADAYFGPTIGLKIKDNFKVSSTGYLTATGATIDGNATITGNTTISGTVTIGGASLTASRINSFMSTTTDGGTSVKYIEAQGGQIGDWSIGALSSNWGTLANEVGYGLYTTTPYTYVESGNTYSYCVAITAKGVAIQGSLQNASGTTPFDKYVHWFDFVTAYQS